MRGLVDWVQSQLDQHGSHDGHAAAVHAEEADRYSTRRGLGEKSQAVEGPTKVLAPGIHPRVEEANDLAGRSIECGKSGMLRRVAGWAGKNKIVVGDGAALGLGDEVVAVEGRVAGDLRVVAVFATISCPLTDSPAKVGRDRLARHSLLGCDSCLAGGRAGCPVAPLLDQRSGHFPERLAVDFVQHCFQLGRFLCRQ